MGDMYDNIEMILRDYVSKADLRKLVVEWGNEIEYARKYKDPIPYHEAIRLCRKQLLEKLEGE